MKHLLWSAVAVLALIGANANAAEITLIAPGGIRAALEDLIPKFEAQSGHKVKATYGSGGGTKAQVIKGEPFDVPVVQLPLEPVIASGNVVPASETPLAHVEVGIAVRTGQPKPDISTADKVKKLLLDAKYIAYPNAAAGAAAGVSFEETLGKLGIAEQMKPKIKPAQGGRGAMLLLAKGRGRHRPHLHQRDHHRARRRAGRPAAAGHFDADGSDRLRILAHQGAGRREGAGQLPVEPGRSRSLQGARHGARALKRRGVAAAARRHDG